MSALVKAEGSGVLRSRTFFFLFRSLFSGLEFTPEKSESSVFHCFTFVAPKVTKARFSRPEAIFTQGCARVKPPTAYTPVPQATAACGKTG